VNAPYSLFWGGFLDVNKYYNRIKDHLSSNGTWAATAKKFPPNAIRSAVKAILKRIDYDPEYLDWGTIFESLKDFETVDDFIKDLEHRYISPELGISADEIEGQMIELAHQLADVDIAALKRVMQRIQDILYGHPPIVVYKGEFNPIGYLEWQGWKSRQR